MGVRTGDRRVWVDGYFHRDGNRLRGGLRDAVVALMHQMRAAGIQRVVIEQEYVIEEDYSI